MLVLRKDQMRRKLCAFFSHLFLTPNVMNGVKVFDLTILRDSNLIHTHTRIENVHIM